MSDEKSSSNPFGFMRNIWGSADLPPLPGMLTPSIRVEDIDRRIAELRVVEHWLKTNLGMLQMTMQGMEMQRVMLASMQTFREQVAEPLFNPPPAYGDEPAPAEAPAAAWTPPETQTRPEPETATVDPFAHFANLWPWNLTQPAPDQDAPAGRKARPATRKTGTGKTAARPKAAPRAKKKAAPKPSAKRGTPDA